jgi:hypothetical protein
MFELNLIPQKMKYVGLTNNPEVIKRKLGQPMDWWQRVFASELEANKWLKVLIKMYGYKEVDDQKGWKYGYTFSNNSN